jgi:hypothetical protein
MVMNDRRHHGVLAYINLPHRHGMHIYHVWAQLWGQRLRCVQADDGRTTCCLQMIYLHTYIHTTFIHNLLLYTQPSMFTQFCFTCPLHNNDVYQAACMQPLITHIYMMHAR